MLLLSNDVAFCVLQPLEMTLVAAAMLCRRAPRFAGVMPKRQRAPGKIVGYRPLVMPVREQEGE